MFLFQKIVLIFEAEGRELAIYLNSESSDQFFKHNVVLTYTWRFLRSIALQKL